jgi:DNA modification methylase
VRNKNIKAQVLITRLPYASSFNTEAILKQLPLLEERALICVAIPVFVDKPINTMSFIHKMSEAGLETVANIVWQRDRHVVVSKSRRLTNTYELIAIFSKSEKYVLSKDAIRKLKKGFEGKTNTFEEDRFLTCQGDHWSVPNDRRDRRFLPGRIVLNLGQLADLKPGDIVLDPFGNPGVSDACLGLGWKYVDGGEPSNLRGVKKSLRKTQSEQEEDE